MQTLIAIEALWRGRGFCDKKGASTPTISQFDHGLFRQGDHAFCVDGLSWSFSDGLSEVKHEPSNAKQEQEIAQAQDLANERHGKDVSEPPEVALFARHPMRVVGGAFFNLESH